MTGGKRLCIFLKYVAKLDVVDFTYRGVHGFLM